MDYFIYLLYVIGIRDFRCVVFSERACATQSRVLSNLHHPRRCYPDLPGEHGAGFLVSPKALCPLFTQESCHPSLLCLYYTRNETLSRIGSAQSSWIRLLPRYPPRFEKLNSNIATSRIKSTTSSIKSDHYIAHQVPYPYIVHQVIPLHRASSLIITTSRIKSRSK